MCDLIPAAQDECRMDPASHPNAIPKGFVSWYMPKQVQECFKATRGGRKSERFNLVNGISFLLLFDNNQNICFRIDSHNSPLSAADDDEIIIILTVVVMYF